MFFSGIAARRRSLRTKLLFVASTAGLAVTGALVLQGPALAQAGGDNSETITVTASRVNRAGYEAPTPTTVVGPATLEAQAHLNTSEYINNLPQMTPVNQGGGSTSIGEQRPNFRSLGPVRTLVLLDGVRVSYTDPQGGVNLDIMPTSLIQNIEVVSGGASADWGSDAVAGVMNFHLNTTLEGIKGNFQCGESQYGDDQQCGGGVGAGTAFLNGKLHVIGALDWESNTGVMKAPDTSRRWANTQTALLFNTSYAPGNGQYKFFVGPSCYVGWNDAGIIDSGILKGTTFNPQGQPEPFIYGTNFSTTNGPLFMQGGTCSKQHSMYVPSTTAPIHRENAYTRVQYDINDNTNVYAEALYAHGTAYNQAIPNYDAGNRTVTIDNAFLSASLKARMTAAGQTNFLFGRWTPELEPNTGRGMSIFKSETEFNRYVIGGKGGIVGSWTWDANVNYSRGQYISNLYGSRNNTLWALSIDSLINPATGLPICRSTLTNPTNGCVPVNLFGEGSISSNVKSYVGGTATGLSYYTATSAAVNIQGEPIDLPAGPVSVAGGFETRTEHLSVVVDPTSALSQWRYQGLQNEAGAYTVNEGYLEAVVPVLKNMSFANDLSVNVAGRLTDYSNSGEVETWKIGVNYTPFESGVVRFRGTLSVDIRAPTLNELYSQLVSSGGNFIQDFACGNCQRLAIQFTGGNPNLTPEVARTKVMGVVFSPDFAGLDGLTMSADYYDIKISNGILALSAQQTVTQCGQGITAACSGVIRDANGLLTSVRAVYFNAQGIEREGVDLEGTYVKDLSDWFMNVPGRLTVHGLAAYVGQNNQTSGLIVINSTGLNGSPMWVGNLSAQYNVDAWQFYAQANWVGGSLVDKSNTLPSYRGDPFYRANNHVPFYMIFSTTVQYQLNNAIQLYAGVDNLLNQGYPAMIGPNLTTTSGVGGSGFYDLIGRRFKVGFRFKF